IDDLAVRPTNSVLRFAGEEQDVSIAGRSLGVDAVLDGRVQEENGLLRVTLQLISVSTGDQLWSDQFDGKVGQILPLQDVISGKLMSALQRRDSDQTLHIITQDSDAYEAYLKGRYFWNQRTPDNYSKAITSFQEAIRLDPNFALAYSGLADSYVLVNRRLDDEPATIMLRAEEAARRGLELNDRLAETHTSMAAVLCAFRRDWQRSNEHFLRAIELNPRYAIARAWYGLNLISLGRFDEAEQQLEAARRLDPTSRNIAVYSIVNFYHSRNFDAAIERGKAAIELDPQLSTAYMYMGQAYEQRGMFAEAVETELERYKSILPDEVDGLRAAFAKSGIRGFWQKQIEVKKRQYDQGVNCRQELATRYALLGEVNKALWVIEENFRFGGTCWNGLANEPAFDGLRSHPRFQAVMREMGF
ncbi:MAG TPA: tetratricopeptide repeat protein, partial [Pyrinomonadaceae bacterium]